MDQARSNWSEVLALLLMLGVAGGVALLVVMLHSHIAFTDQATATVEQELQLRGQLAGFDANLQDIESAKRGYILTGSTAMLTPYNAAVARIGNRLEWLAHNSRGEPEDEAAVRDISGRLGRRILQVENALALARQDGLQAARALVIADAVDGELVAIGRATHDMDERSRLRSARLHRQIAERTRMVQSAMMLIMVGTLTAFFALVISMRRSLRNREAIARQLHGAKAAAESASRAKSEFLASMSHELRTPLNAILGFSEIIRDQMLGPEKAARYSDYANDIHSSGQHLLRLIDDILDIAKTEAGRMQLDRTWVDLPGIIDDSLRMIAGPAAKAGVTLSVVTALDLPRVFADELRIRQILLNLLSNAVKFTLPGGHVAVSATRDGSDLLLAVQDDGIGIAPEKLPYVLIPFGRADSRLSRQGSGLGLSIANGLVRLHGGRLRLSSTPGEGTRVEVRLVLDADGADRPLTTGEAVSGRIAPTVKSLAGAGILLAALAAPSPTRAGGTAEVIHWWTSPSESAAMGRLIRAFEATGNHWLDRPVTGAGNARTVVRARLFGDTPPTAAQWVLGYEVERLARAGFLQPLARPAWDHLLPPAVRDQLRTPAGYIAVPTGIHARNWIWINKPVFDRIGAQPPESWDQFNEVADRLRGSGIIPLALGGEPWQEYLVFESVTAGIGGADFYRRALQELDDEALNSPTMLQIFTQLRRLVQFADPAFVDRNWEAATALVMEGRAAMMIMGDWAKGDLIQARFRLGQDFDCIPVPGTGDMMIFKTDVLLFFKNRDPAQKALQETLADLVMDPGVQHDFNLIKGSAPILPNADPTDFDRCARHDMRAVNEPARLLPAADPQMPEDMVAAIQEAVSRFFHYDLAPETGVAMLRRAIAAHR